MHRPIRPRAILPAIQFPLYLALIWFGCPYRSTWIGWLSLSAGDVSWSWIDGPMSLPEKTAVVLNFPAEIVVASLLDLLRPQSWSGAVTELTEHALVAATILPTWYLIGRAIERKSAAIVRGE